MTPFDAPAGRFSGAAGGAGPEGPAQDARARRAPHRQLRQAAAEPGSARREATPARSVLLVDNYDSFTYNLAHLLEELGAEVTVLRNDAVDADAAAELAPSHLVISPGPGRPQGAGATLEIVGRLAPTTPTLGVCLGHQAIVEAFGGEVGRARRLVHGKASLVRHGGVGLFAGLPNPLEAGRYHSLAATRVPETLEVTARTDDGEVMGVRHREYPVDGIQFHPESVLTPNGRDLLATFLGAAR